MEAAYRRRWCTDSRQSKYKRLKRGHKERVKTRGIDDIFSDDEGIDDLEEPRRIGGDEFDGFIEDDQFEDEIEDDRDVTQPGVSLITQGLQAAGLDEGAEEDYRAAFGDGTDYDWALDMQEAEEEEQAGEGRELQLKDVFEPSQLQERMLTDEDNVIRETDIPERLQLARRPFKDLELTPEDMQTRLTEEATWISSMLWPKKGLPGYFKQPFEKAVRKVLEFINIEDYEVPFIFNHRKDYLIHAPSDNDDFDDPDNPPPMDARPERLLNQSDLWEVFDTDLKFRAFAEKRDALRQNYENVRSVYPEINDTEIEELATKAMTIEEVQELQDYLHYRYSQEMTEVRQEVNGGQKRANNARSFFDKLRGGKAHQFVKAIGITPEDFAKKADGTSRGVHTVDDPPYLVEELADQMAEAPETGASLIRSAKLLFVQDLQMSSRLRRFLRGNFYQNALIDCIRTDKGMRKITEDHTYYEFKYLRHQTFMDLQGRPDLFLKMLKAEHEGLVHVKIGMQNYKEFKARLYKLIVSDSVSDAAASWNGLRKELLDLALDKLSGIIANGVKESLRARCEDELASRARENYYNKLDQAPYKLKGAPLGSIPNVLCLTNGKGQRGDAIMWAYVENDGRVLEQGRLVEMRLGNQERGITEGQDIAKLVDVIQRRRPDVIGVSGFTVETRKLYKDIQEIIQIYNLTGPTYEDDNGAEGTDPLEVIMVNDEVARLYHTSARATTEFPKYAPLTKYCIALGRYLQNPLAEYASLGKDIVSIPFIPQQTLIPQEKLLERLETAMVDMVNLVGIDLPETYDDGYMSKLLPYVCGLGPRKADRLVKAIQANGDEVLSRIDLLGVSENASRDLKAAMGPKVFQNCASFLYIPYDSSEDSSDYLDYTRVHPEDYDLARKMVADALNMDEEDVKAETDEGGPSAVIRKMVRDDATDLVNDLALEDYAAEIERNFGQRKRATLETIRAELETPYEEIRQIFALMSGEELFTMLTGETKETLYEGMVVPVTIRRTFPDHIEVKLECGIEGGVSESEFPEGVGSGGQEPRHVYQSHQVVRARIVYLNRKALTAQLSLRDDLIRQPEKKMYDRVAGDWDEAQEAADKKAAEKEKEVASGRPNRVVNHPLFFSFNTMQAEEYLGSKETGDLVIRPSSKGFDHLVVTWKVSNNAYQHLDVLEMDKPNQFTLGKQLRIGKQTYSDLDELIVNHVEAMARKVTELTRDERFQFGTKEETGKSFPLIL